ncbi:MAG: hypothetical protein ACRD50_08290 [Candidatus Acidiferrales bacterium]
MLLGAAVMLMQLSFAGPATIHPADRTVVTADKRTVVTTEAKNSKDVNFNPAKESSSLGQTLYGYPFIHPKVYFAEAGNDGKSVPSNSGKNLLPADMIMSSADIAKSLSATSEPNVIAPAAPFREWAGGVQHHVSRTWLALSIGDHAAATFDAWSTRRALQGGGRYEADPLMRPFANSGLIYAAVQVLPSALDYAALHMQRNHLSWVRHMWWMPQSLSIAGSLFAGSHNVANTR